MKDEELAGLVRRIYQELEELERVWVALRKVGNAPAAQTTIITSTVWR